MISDELAFKSQLISAYDLYSDFVQDYMNMIIHGYYDNQAVTSTNEVLAQQVNAVRVRNKKEALRQLEYTCEIDPAHESFINPETGKRYMKAVYLIPGSESLDIEWDRISNICCLCPNCAERIRYGTDSDRQEMLTALYFKHKNDLEVACYGNRFCISFKIRPNPFQDRKIRFDTRFTTRSGITMDKDGKIKSALFGLL